MVKSSDARRAKALRENLKRRKARAKMGVHAAKASGTVPPEGRPSADKKSRLT